MNYTDITALKHHMSRKLKNVSTTINHGWTMIIDSKLTIKESEFFVRMGASPYTSTDDLFEKGKTIIQLLG